MADEIFTYGNQCFSIRKLLGRGKSGHSYLMENETGRFVLKRMHDETCPYYRFSDKLESELSAYEKLKAAGIRIPELLAYDRNEKFLIKEYIDGDIAAWIIALNQLKDAEIRQIFKMARRACENGINLDFFPTNFVIRKAELFYIDYEFNPYTEEWNFENWGIYYWINAQGMKDFLNNGDATKINADLDMGKPIRAPFEEIASRWIATYGRDCDTR